MVGTASVSCGDCLVIQRASPHSCGACGHLIILTNYMYTDSVRAIILFTAYSTLHCKFPLPLSLLPLPPPSFRRSIQGFMQRTDAEKMLLQRPNGTFLIRFSEGDPGGISVAWVNGEMSTSISAMSMYSIQHRGSLVSLPG